MNTNPLSDGFPTTLADLAYHLPSTNTNRSIYSTISALRKSTLSISNRLRSVVQDADFIEALHRSLSQKDVTAERAPPSWPLIPNERSGSWPLDPTLKTASQAAYLSSTDTAAHKQPVSAYFKSTDGHISQWMFNTRRLNLPVLGMLGRASACECGCILIDTTRRGKSYPDALRRTVPVWCAVWNRALFPELQDSGICDFQGFRLDAGEISQIEARIPTFVKNLKVLGLDLKDLRAKVLHPIRCVWISQPADKRAWSSCVDELRAEIEAERRYWQEKATVENINILVCCSASRQVLGAEMSDDNYIQGAGDDTEHWSHGLTAKMFWENKNRLLDATKDAGENDMEELVRHIVAESKAKSLIIAQPATHITPTTNLFLAHVSKIDSAQTSTDFDLTISCNAVTDDSTSKWLCLGCKEGKLGSRTLREKLPLVKATVEQVLNKSTSAKILVTCKDGRDLSVGVALTLLCCFFDEQGKVNFPIDVIIDKQFIRQRLVWITSSKPDINPSRATLQAVNAFLMDRPD